MSCTCTWQKVKCFGPLQNVNYTRTQIKKRCEDCKIKSIKKRIKLKQEEPGE